MKRLLLYAFGILSGGLFALDAMAVAPSFDCKKATKPDEIAICSDANLARNDHLTTDGFNEAKRVNREAALVTARAFLKIRSACRADAACIAKAQYQAIVDFSAVSAATTKPAAIPRKANTEEQKRLQADWEKCLEVFALTVAEGTNEPAAIVVEGAMAACQEPENAMFRYFNSQEPKALSDFLVLELMPMMAADYKKKTLAKVLAHRAAR